MHAMPDLERLRADGLIPHYFGLGFIQIKLDERRRLHFWVPDWPTIPGAEHELHDHRYSFTSHVVQGRLTQEVFALGDVKDEPFEGAMELVHVTCKPGMEGQPLVQGFTRPVFLTRFELLPGSSYRLAPDAFHRAHSFAAAVTMVVRDGHERDYARVLRPAGSSFVCPFSIEKTTEDCWERMKKMRQPLTGRSHL